MSSKKQQAAALAMLRVLILEGEKGIPHAALLGEDLSDLCERGTSQALGVVAAVASILLADAWKAAPAHVIDARLQERIQRLLTDDDRPPPAG